MLQPFIRLEPRFIDQMIQLKKIFLVSQTYTRGAVEAEPDKTSLLLTDYDDLGLAKIHHNAVKEDRFAAIVTLTKAPHLAKVQEMMEPDSSYLLYWAVIHPGEDLEKRINSEYRHNLRRYVDYHTRWRLGRDHVIKAGVQLIFGELYMLVKHRRETLKVKLSEIEQY